MTSRAPRSRFERLYREHAPFVWAAARSCAPAAAVDDVVQDVFVTAYRRMDDLHAEVSPRGWLYGVTRKVAFRYRRSDARTARRVAAVAATRGAPRDPQPALDATGQVDAMLARLPPGQRRLVVMSELLGMSGKEIAAELGVPVNTAYSRVRAVRRRLESMARSAEALDRSLERHRAEARPSQRQVQRGWVALAPLVRSPWATLTTTSGLLRSLGAAIAIGSTTLVVIAVIARGATSESPPKRADAEAIVDAPNSKAPSSADPAETAPNVETPTVPSDPPPPAPDTDHETARVSSVGARSPTRSGGTATDPETEPSTKPDGIEAELALLERARQALAAGRPDDALNSLAEHARRFPQSSLADARKASRVRALCARGDRTAARAEADALRREHPDSALATSLANACEP